MALAQIVTALEQVEHWVAVQALPAPAPLAVAQQVVAQEVTSTASGQPTVREGVAHDRRISIEDGEMRHGRKSRSRLIDGYKRHVLRDLDQGLVRAVGLTLANAPEATVTEAIVADLAAQQATLAELHIDRAYLSSTLVRERPADLAVYCKAWPVPERRPLSQDGLSAGLGARPAYLPAPGTAALHPRGHRALPRRRLCPLPPAGPLHGQRQGAQRAHPPRRAPARGVAAAPAHRPGTRQAARTRVRRSLAHIGHWQGWRARYRGQRKNLFDLRRAAVVHNLFVWRQFDQQARAA